MIIKDAEKYACSFEYGKFHFGYAHNVFGVYLSYKVTPYKNKTGLRVDVKLANLYGRNYLKYHRSIKFGGPCWRYGLFIVESLNKNFELIKQIEPKIEQTEDLSHLDYFRNSCRRIFDPTWEDNHLPLQKDFDSAYREIGYLFDIIIPVCLGFDARFSDCDNSNENSEAI